MLLTPGSLGWRLTLLLLIQLLVYLYDLLACLFPVHDRHVEVKEYHVEVPRLLRWRLWLLSVAALTTVLLLEEFTHILLYLSDSQIAIDGRDDLGLDKVLDLLLADLQLELLVVDQEDLWLDLPPLPILFDLLHQTILLAITNHVFVNQQLIAAI